MGQYYKGVILDKNYKKVDSPVLFAVTSWQFCGGAKLTEHSYVGNTYVNIYARLLAEKFYDSRVVWAGAYADETLKGKTMYSAVTDDICKLSLNEIDGLTKSTRRAGDYYEVEGGFPKYKYIINFTKRQYVEIPDESDKDWVLHPLPLLCCDGNGRGGGDYFSSVNKDLVGKWAYDRIGIGNEIPEGFKPLKYQKIHNEDEKIIFKE